MEEIFAKRQKSFMAQSSSVTLRNTTQSSQLSKAKKQRQAVATSHRKKFKTEFEDRLQSLTLPSTFTLIHSESINSKIQGARDLRLILSRNYTPPLPELIDSGVVPILISFTTLFDHPELQYESAWALSNIASGDMEHTKVLVDKGIIPKILDLLTSPHEHVQDQGVWVLGNITGDSSSYSEQICQFGGIQKLIHIIKTCSADYLLKSAVWALGNLCKGEKSPEFSIIKDAIPVFCELLNRPDEDLVKDSLWVLSSLTEYSEESGNIIISFNVLPRIVSLFSHHDTELQLPAITIIGRVAAGSDMQTSAAIAANAVFCLTPLLNSPKREIRKEAIWCLSNFAAGTEEHIESLVKNEIFQKIIKIIYRDEKYVKVEALWVIANAAGKGNTAQVNDLVKAGVIGALVRCLSVEDNKVLQVVLLGVKLVLMAGNKLLTESGINPYAVIFEESDGVRLLDKLQYKANTKVYEDSYYILSTFFEGVPVDQDLVDMIVGE